MKGRLRSCTQSAHYLVVGGLFGWTAGPMLEVVEKYKETLKKYPNPPAANLTKF